jgi:hypothetical protein
MKLARIVVLAAFALLSAAQAQADSIPTSDPTIRTGPPPGGGHAPTLSGDTSPAPAAIITTDFMVMSPSGTSPVSLPGGSDCLLFQFGVQTADSPTCLFENDIETKGVAETLTSLTFIALGISADTVSCQNLAGSPFAQCGVEAIEGGTEVNFTNGAIPFHQDFTLQFQDFPENFSFSSQATAVVPEPGTLAMFLAGIGALLVGRRLRVR